MTILSVTVLYCMNEYPQVNVDSPLTQKPPAIAGGFCISYFTECVTVLNVYLS